MHEIKLLADCKNLIGEGPLWDPEEKVLYWIDSLEPSILRYNPATSEVRKWDLPEHIGSMALREKGGAVLGLRNGFHFFDFNTGKCELIYDPEPDQPRSRLNDGKTDRKGRFFAGGMDYDEADEICGLYRLDPDLSCHEIDRGIIVSNGPCFSPDDKTFYFADTWKDAIFVYDYDITTGTVKNKRVFASTKDTRGSPDGATVDAEGYVWSVMVTGGCINRYSPDGRIDRIIDFPVRNLTSITFGGENLDILYVTTMARVHFGKKPEEPDAGGLFAIYGLGIKGLPEPRFAG